MTRSAGIVEGFPSEVGLPLLELVADLLHELRNGSAGPLDVITDPVWSFSRVLPDIPAELDILATTDWALGVMESAPLGSELAALCSATRSVLVVRVDDAPDPCFLRMHGDSLAEYDALQSSAERGQCLDRAAAPFRLPALEVQRGSWIDRLSVLLYPCTVSAPGRAAFPVSLSIQCDERRAAVLPAAVRSGLVDMFLAEVARQRRELCEERRPVELPREDPRRIQVAGSIGRPLFALSETKLERDAGKLAAFRESCPPLAWAVMFALFDATTEDNARDGHRQRISVAALVDRVYCVRGRGARSDGFDQARNVMATTLQLFRAERYGYAFKSESMGGGLFRSIATLELSHPIATLRLVFINRATGREGIPGADIELRALASPLRIRGKNQLGHNGEPVLALPTRDWKLEAIEWSWSREIERELFGAVELEESGKRRGLPKRRAGERPLRHGSVVQYAQRIYRALDLLRRDFGDRSLTTDLVISLASNLNSTEDGIGAERLWRMLGIHAPCATREDLTRADTLQAVERLRKAIERLMAPDVAVLCAGSDREPRFDDNEERRKGGYYRLVRAGDMRARREEQDPRSAPLPLAVVPNAELLLPTCQEEPLPTSEQIRQARATAGLTVRAWARRMGFGSPATWNLLERGLLAPARTRLPRSAWDRCRDLMEG